ncbi:hypothetical protein BKA62DRAFT_375160 [Auriculariales sp. MPI-PUGE-AT-0066]|nr:hypothetical protein BKA62DRAFT_375160 [Auriculariales sp. MPI-PUGE-AT-0066]
MSKQSTLSYSVTLPISEDLDDSVLFPPFVAHDTDGLEHRTRRLTGDRSSKYRIPARRYDSIGSDTSTHFDRKYPPDIYGQEASDNARVWQVYCDESSEQDQAMLEGWNKTLDILLIFAGLFSAVSTTFIIESYSALQPDYNAYTANILFVLATSQSSSSPMPNIPPPDEFTITGATRWTNGLWFTSLVLSLSVALLSILAKQWLDEYRARISGPFQSARYWARRRALFFRGLKAWHLPAFISTLPVLLHISLFLFFGGLVLFLWPLDKAIAGSILGLSGLVFTFYCISVLLPLWQPDCPWRIPLVDQLFRLSTRTARLWRAPASQMLKMTERLLERAPLLTFSRLRQSVSAFERTVGVSAPLYNAEQQERKLIQDRTASLDASALRWLLRSSPAQDVVAVGVQAIGALPPWDPTLVLLRATEVPDLVRDHVELSFPKASMAGSFIQTEADAARCSRYLRSWISIYIERSVYSESQLLARLIRYTMPNSHDLPLLRFIIRWTLLHDADSNSFLTSLKKRNVNEREREKWVFLPQTVLQGITLVVFHRSNRVQRALSAILHLFHAGRLWEEDEEDLQHTAEQIGTLLTAMGARYVDTSVRSGVEACIDYWSMSLNQAVFYQLDNEDVHVAARSLGLLVARSEAQRKS